MKIQLHPRFLFHSLHGVKKHIYPHPSLAANLILQLSDLLSYILYESNEEWVSLGKELDMIKSYIDLEKKSSANVLFTEIHISGTINGKCIFPLLLLSFIENVFDCFLKDNNQDPSLKLLVNVSADRLDYHLDCSRLPCKSQNEDAVKEKFADLEKQLQLMYAGTYKLQISTDAQSILVELSLPIYTIINKQESLVPQNDLYELL